MFVIKNGSNFDVIVHEDDAVVDEYGSIAKSDIIFETTEYCGTQVCDCCGSLLINLVSTISSQELGQGVIYETEIKNIKGFENCTTKEECDELIYRHICDFYSIAHDRRTVKSV